jgi:hypothetical protein
MERTGGIGDASAAARSAGENRALGTRGFADGSETFIQAAGIFRRRLHDRADDDDARDAEQVDAAEREEERCGHAFSSTRRECNRGELLGSAA